MGINTDQTDISTCPLSNGKDSYEKLGAVLYQCKTDMLNPPSKLSLLGNINDSSNNYYILLLIYIDSYINKYGADSVYDVINEPGRILFDLEPAYNLLDYLRFCLFENQDFNIDGCVCSNGAVKDLDYLTNKVFGGESITAYGFSEFSGYFLKHAADMGVQIDICDIIAPPLNYVNQLLMYTDGLIINKAKLTPNTQPDIDAFIQFYTSLNTRLSVAFGDDIHGFHPARYLLQARNDFYSDSRVTGDGIYAKLSPFLQYAVAAPNKDFYQKMNNFGKHSKRGTGYRGIP